MGFKDLSEEEKNNIYARDSFLESMIFDKCVAGNIKEAFENLRKIDIIGFKAGSIMKIVDTFKKEEIEQYILEQYAQAPEEMYQYSQSGTEKIYNIYTKGNDDERLQLILDIDQEFENDEEVKAEAPFDSVKVQICKMIEADDKKIEALQYIQNENLKKEIMSNVNERKKETDLENLSIEELSQMSKGLDEEIANVEIDLQTEKEKLIAEVLRKKALLKSKRIELAELRENNREKEERKETRTLEDTTNDTI